MIYLFALVLFVMILIVFLFNQLIHVSFVLNSDSDRIFSSSKWLYPFFYATFTIDNKKPIISIYLFKLKIAVLSPTPTKKSMPLTQLYSIASPKNININLEYGFTNPCLTGVACGVLNAASQLINIQSIESTPCFFAPNDYFYLNAKADINIGNAIINLCKARKYNSK